MSVQQRQDMLKKKIQIQNMIILALAIVIIVLIVVSSTAAWYIRTKSDSADIILSNPVNIYITEYEEKTGIDGSTYFDHETVQDILEGYRNRIYPGDKIKLKLGMQVGSEDEASSPAYVRVKLNMAFSKISDDPNAGDIPLEQLQDEGLIEYINEPNSNDWILIDFNKFATAEEGQEVEPDYWYVLKTTTESGTRARVVQDTETLEFLDGYIRLSKTEITNKHANCKFHITYSVEAIRVVNVPDPILNEGYGPWWNFCKGDIEDI